MNRKSRAIVLFIVSSIVFTACIKNPEKETTPQYKVQNIIKYDPDGSQQDSVAYIYSGNNLSRIDITGNKIVNPDGGSVIYPSFNTTFEYSESRIAKSIKTAKNPDEHDLDSYSKIWYNSDKTIRSVHYYSNDNIENYVDSFYYSNNKLNKEIISYRLGEGSSIEPRREYDYTVSADGNISSVKVIDLGSGFTYTYNYTFDNVNNYYRKLFPQPQFSDVLPNFVMGSVVPFLFSANNVKTITYSTNTLNFTYTTNTKNNLSQVSLNGKTVAKYNY